MATAGARTVQTIRTTLGVALTVLFTFGSIVYCSAGELGYGISLGVLAAFAATLAAVNALLGP